MGAWPPKAGEVRSRTLDCAVAAGLPPMMSYTVAQLAKITGFDRKAIYMAHEHGSLPFVMPDGCSRGARVLVFDADSWIESMRGAQ